MEAIIEVLEELLYLFIEDVVNVKINELLFVLLIYPNVSSTWFELNHFCFSPGIVSVSEIHHQFVFESWASVV